MGKNERAGRGRTFDVTPGYYYSGPISPHEEAFLSRLLVNDDVFAFQLPYLNAHGAWRGIPPTGIKGMYFAAFESGVQEALMKITGKTPEQRKEQLKKKRGAIWWIRTQTGMLSFNWYCDIFQIDVEQARNELLRNAEIILRPTDIVPPKKKKGVPAPRKPIAFEISNEVTLPQVAINYRKRRRTK